MALIGGTKFFYYRHQRSMRPCRCQGIRLNTGCRGTTETCLSTENILELRTEKVVEALNDIKSVKFSYKLDADKEINLGFIGEDVPDLVTVKDRKGASSLEVVAVGTKVI